MTTQPTQDWATPGIRAIACLEPEAPKDFNEVELRVGDRVLFARGRGILAEGIIVEQTQFPGAITVQSLVSAERLMTIDAIGAIKVPTA